MAKVPKTCPVVVAERAGQLGLGKPIVCGAPVVRKPDDGRDPYCPRCETKYPRE